MEYELVQAETCLESNAFLRKSLTRKCFRSFEREGAVDDNLGPSVETTDCIQDVIENNTQLTCSAQATEIYIPVPDCLLPRDDKLFLVVKEENEGHLSEENNPMQYTSDPAGISSDVSDPLTTDDLSDRVTYKCSPVKEDQISDGEEGYVLNDCSDGVSSKLVHQDSSDQPNTLTASQGEKVETQSRGDIVADLDLTLIGAKKELSPEENAQCNVKGENEELLSGGNYPAFNSSNTGGLSSETSDPLSIDGLPMFTKDEKLIDNWKMTKDSTTKATGISTPDKVLMETTSTSCVLKERNVTIDLNHDFIAPAVSLTIRQSNTVTSHVGKGMNVMDKYLEEGSAHHAEKIMSDSIPDDGHSYKKHIPASNNGGNGATMNVVGCRGDAPNIRDSLRIIRIGECKRSGIEAVMGDKKEISNCFIENPSNGKNSNKKLYYCSHCRYGFNTKSDLIKHMEIHFGASNLDLDAESSMGKNECLIIPASSDVSNNSCESSTSETLKGLKRKRQVPMHKVNTPVVKSSCGMKEKKTLGGVRSIDGDGQPHAQNESTSCAGNLQNDARGCTKGGPFSCSVCAESFTLRSSLNSHMRAHAGRKRYPCTICSKSFTKTSGVTEHMRIHAKEKPFLCKTCFKSFTKSYQLTNHMRTHSGEKPFACSDCAKSFTRRDNLIRHLRIHSGTRPFTCNLCCKSFTSSSSLTNHMLKHSGERPFLCNNCQKSFTRKYSLMLHLRMHAREKSFSCNHCAESFSCKSSLNQHVRTHKVKRPYYCKICSKNFAESSTLNAHMHTHAEVKPFSLNDCAVFL
ncbi:zinc finger protein 774-like [Ischnura elegans]|uniref:zinc finger protein 774-like n=1 Tax=Ischnura elegans TaxID=197161 RepID=UPI001ED8AEFA|nr:zinc finger protein 774-like [Ischnura elegans]